MVPGATSRASRPISPSDPHVDGIVLTIRDDEARRALRHRATHDPLTGLANRELFHERLADALRDGEAAVLYVDLDGFKPVNDRFGHAAGDEVLRIVARRLLASVRATDTVARLGGDEFALLLGEPGRAEHVAERVQAAFARPLQVGGQPVVISASVGVASGGRRPARRRRPRDVRGQARRLTRPRATLRGMSETFPLPGSADAVVAAPAPGQGPQFWAGAPSRSWTPTARSCSATASATARTRPTRP